MPPRALGKHCHALGDPQSNASLDAPVENDRPSLRASARKGGALHFFGKFLSVF